MINTDLRINNYVLANGKTDQISEVKTFEISVYGCEDNVVLVKPIPLTEEWLVAFGFDSQCGNEWHFESACFEWFYDEFYYTAGEGCKMSISIKHVHQLQNLYFALTGKELIIEK